MKIVIYSNYLNHHQLPLADSLYELLGEDFGFVATQPTNEDELKGGHDFCMLRDYCLRAYEDEVIKNKAIQWAKESDVCVFGACSLFYAKERAKHSKNLSFYMSERWLKRGWINVLSPHFLKWELAYLLWFKYSNWKMLCASAFAAIDFWNLHQFRNRCYKWGYFINAISDNYGEVPESVSTSRSITMMWCARFLKWKHPELVVQLAHVLKDNGYNVKIDMYGSGEILESTMALCQELNVQDIVSFKGNVPNEEVRKAMREHDIFLFTSDKNEGWGVVLNEAMVCGCAVVGSDAIGSVPYLIKDGENGMIFKNLSIGSLYEKVKYLIEHPVVRQQMAIKGQHDIQNLWSPQNAAQSLLRLIEDLKAGRETSVMQGPCSKA